MARKNDGKESAPAPAPAPAPARKPSGAGPGARSLRRSDEALASEIYEILTKDPELDATEIEVEVEGGAVMLTGMVENPDAKLLAEELVESVAGVREIHNHLKVSR